MIELNKGLPDGALRTTRDARELVEAVAVRSGSPARAVAKQAPGLRALLHRWRRLVRPAWLGTVRRTAPVSQFFGYDRGTPVDRYYISDFVRCHRKDIRGHVLEVQDPRYAIEFGSAAERVDVLDIDGSNPRATIVADLTTASGIPSDEFDCFILTQTLQLIYDVRAALESAYRILRPGGVLLATVPALSRHALYAEDYWRFTADACQQLFSEVFGPGQVSVTSFGNVLAGVAFHLGMAQEELSARELEVNDPSFPLIIGIRAVKRG